MNVRSLTAALVLALSIVSIRAAAPETVWVTSLGITNVASGWGAPHADKAVSGKTMSIAGQKFQRGIGVHAPSKMRIDLSGRGKTFLASAGVDDGSKNNGSVEFLITGDGKTLWKSGVLKSGEAARRVKLNIEGVRVLTLRVTDAGDGTKNDHADWADARIEMAAAGTAPVALQPNDSFSLATKNLTIAYEVGDDGRLYQHPLGGAPGKLNRYAEAYPQAGDGYVWEPALQVVHADGNTSTDLLFDGISRNVEQDGREMVRVRLKDPAYPFSATIVSRIHASRDVIEQWVEISHSEQGPVKLERMASSSPVMEKAHLLHFYGDWANEMNPVVELVTPGTKVLDSKLGMRAHRFQSPSFVLSLDGPPAENSGRVLAGSLAWSGNFQFAFDNNGKQVRALCGVNPFASAYHLGKGEVFTTPVMIWAWSDKGLGDMSRKLHSWARDYGFRDGHKPREVLLNNWEATKFDFDFSRIAGLFPPAKQMGVELFLLDDGWFGNKYPRVNDKAGLGDWEPNHARLPGGIAPLAKAAIDQGLRFGIWIEPEMVNPASELFENHPDWVIRQPKRDLEFQRNQLTLDLTRPEVQEFEWGVIKSVMGVPGVSYVKWDCNRYVTQPGSPWLPPGRQSHLWIDYVKALYKLMEQTRAEFPGTELMLCSGGGGRVDYGAMKYFHEFWPSDNTDPVRRVTMQWDYSYFFPSMTIASHVTHWGKRPIHFACAVAMSERFGMDLDLAGLTEEEKTVCAGAIAAYKQIRETVHLGDLYRLERPHDAERGALSYVATNKSHSVLFVFQMKDGQPKPVLPQGLDSARKYKIHELNPAPGRGAVSQEGWVFSGEELMRSGIVPSCSKEMEACVIELSAP